jgi:hypothetical protein
VRDQHQRHAAFLLQIAQQVEDLGLDRDVERGGGFVGDQQARVARDRHRDHHALVHAAGHLVRVVVHARSGGWDADLLQQFDRVSLARSSSIQRRVQPQRFDQLVADGEAGIQAAGRVLEDHRHVLADEAAGGRGRRSPGGRGRQSASVFARTRPGPGDEAHEAPSS